MLARTISQVCEIYGSVNFIKKDEKVALKRGVPFTMLVIHFFLPLVTNLRQWFTQNVYLHEALAAYNNTSSRAPSDKEKLDDVYQQFVSQDDYYSVEYSCFIALLIVTLIRQADFKLVNSRHPYLRQTALHRRVVIMKKFVMGGIVLTSINCLILSWMRTKSCDTVLVFTWSFNLCAVVTELITISKFIFAILNFTSLVSKYPTIFGHILQKRSRCGIGCEEICQFLVMATILEVTNTCNQIATWVLNVACWFVVILISWNIVSVIWKLISHSASVTFALKWMHYTAFSMVGKSNQTISTEELKYTPNDQLPEDHVRLPVTQDGEKMSLIISKEKTDEISLVAKFRLESAPQQDNIALHMNNKTMHTSLALLEIKRMSCPEIHFEIFEKKDISLLYDKLCKCFEPSTKQYFAINLYKKTQQGICVGLTDDDNISFCIPLEDVLNASKPDQSITKICIDVVDTDESPPGNVHFYERVNWKLISKSVTNIITDHLKKKLTDEEPPGEGEHDVT